MKNDDHLCEAVCQGTGGDSEDDGSDGCRMYQGVILMKNGLDLMFHQDSGRFVMLVS